MDIRYGSDPSGPADDSGVGMMFGYLLVITVAIGALQRTGVCGV